MKKYILLIFLFIFSFSFSLEPDPIRLKAGYIRESNYGKNIILYNSTIARQMGVYGILSFKADMYSKKTKKFEPEFFDMNLYLINKNVDTLDKLNLPYTKAARLITLKNGNLAVAIVPKDNDKQFLVFNSETPEQIFAVIKYIEISCNDGYMK